MRDTNHFIHRELHMTNTVRDSAPTSREKQFVYKSTLSKGYGLTPAMIEELGEPDKLCDNPHWSSGPPASLYRVKRVEAWIEGNEERVERARASRVRRSAAGTAVQEMKRGERHRQAVN